MTQCVFLILMLGLVAGGNANAASLRNNTTLHGPNVYLRDLFDDGGRSADILLGPGPNPGGRIIVEAPQLNAIARQFGVEWRSTSSAERTVLEWPGQPIPHEDVATAVRAAVIMGGGPEDCEIDIQAFSPPLLPSDAKPQSTVSQLDYNRDTGRFAAWLSITGANFHPINTRISGRVQEMTDVPVAATLLSAETVLSANDLRIARVRVSPRPNEIANSASQIVGMQLRRTVPVGQTLQLADLARPIVVQRAVVVQIQLELPGFSIGGQALSLQAGAVGEKIHVQTLNSRAILDAEVIGPGQVRLLPDLRPTVSRGSGR